MNSQPTTRPPSGGEPRDESLASPLDTASLFGDKRELVILHNGEAYRLRITRQGKLILTK